ncbi:MAG TPA: aldo/keto reductase [Acidimicrobiales bacterium]|nr:aldo/keto reductase [Acidimicrobiales bacterium]
MQYRQLGRSGLRVSVISLGTMTFGGTGPFANVGNAGVDEAMQVLDRAMEAGVNLVDTADVYSEGASEEIVGQVVKGRREGLLLASKCRFSTLPGANGAGSSRYHIIRSLEGSLRRLGTDYIDLYQLHGWDGQTALDETLSCLDTLVRSGKVRYIGCSNYSAWHLMKALAVSERRQLERFACHQIYWSMIGRDVEFEVVPATVDQGLGILVWSPLAGGLLTGKYRRDRRPEGGRHLTAWSEPPIYDEAKVYDIIDALVAVAEARGVPAAQVSLAWLLSKPAVTSVIVGARDALQLSQTLPAADLELTPQELARLDAVSASPLPYPLWHQAKTVSDRFSDADRLAIVASQARQNT